MIDLPEGFEFSDEPARLDRRLVHHWLSGDAYWAIGRSREKQDSAINGSINYGVYRSGSGEQVAYTRVVTDQAMFAWICDVYVDPTVRGLGVGKAMMDGVIEALDELGVWRQTLVTGDAHALYAKYGFEALDHPDNWMTRISPNGGSGGPGGG